MEELFEKLKAMNLPKGKFAVFASGPMVIRKLRESKKVEIIVTRDIFDEFRKKDGWSIKNESCEGLQKDNIEMYYEWGPGEWDINKLIQEAETIDDLPFVKLEEVLRWKKIYNREKDQKDVELIENYLNQKLNQ